MLSKEVPPFDHGNHRGWRDALHARQFKELVAVDHTAKELPRLNTLVNEDRQLDVHTI